MDTRKLIASDYDDTFYINDEDIEKNKIAVKEFEKKGNIFVIATGRSFLDFTNKADTYKIKYKYVILNHGATIIDNKNNIICNFPIENEVIPKIKKELHLENTIRNFCCSELESRVNFEHKDLTKIHARYNTTEEAREVNEILNKKFSKYITSYFISKNSVEVISNKTSKSNAISILKKKLNIEDKNIYTIGDGFSDIEMVRDFNGYCMKNSVEELKRIAIKQFNSVSELIKEVMEKI